METEDFISLPNLSDSGSGSESGELNNNLDGSNDVDSLPDMELSDGEIGNEDTPVVKTSQGVDVVENLSAAQVSVESTEIVTIREELNAENCCFDVHNESPIRKRRMEDNSSRSDVKRARITVEDQPSVHVNYKGLTRASKRKLEEVLQQWSEWHAQHDSKSQDTNEVIECGEETFFPAIRVGLKKSSAVSFWIDNQTRNEQNKYVPLDGTSVPVYDRGYALGLTSAEHTSNLEGGLEILHDAMRCFNCGSYSHALKECPKPRDNVAVNNARKQHKSKRNMNLASRNPIRYYQNSRGGKYDDLRPGALGAETRELLGLGELDPPPWLNRMRELGYPPGYLDSDDEDLPSGITIFADGEIKEEHNGEDGEIIETEQPEPQRKMTVKFPGINAPIPENADEKHWAAQPSSSDLLRTRTHHRLDNSSEPIMRGHHHHREHRRSGEFRDDGPPGVDPIFSPSSYPPRYREFRDDGPPGVDSVFSPKSYPPRYGEFRDDGPPGVDPVFSPSSYPPRYGSYDSFDHSRAGRSHSDRGRRSPVVYEDFVSHSSFSYPTNHHTSPPDRGSIRYESDRYERRSDYELDYSRRSMHEPDGYRHHSRR